MVDLVKSEHQRAISLMPPQFAALMTARFEGRKIAEMAEREAMMYLKEQIILCIRSIGHYSEANDSGVVAFLCQGLRIEIIKNRKNLTDRELEMILSNLSKGQYKRKKDEFIACNLLSINLAMDAFFDAPERKLALTDYNLRLNERPNKVELTPQEAQEVVRKGCLNAFKDFLTDGSMPKYGAVYYKYLKPRLNITWNDQESEEIRTIAKQKSVGDETNYQTECKNVALHRWFIKLKLTTNYDQFKSLLEPFKQ